MSGSNAASGGSVRWSAPELVGSITARQERWVHPTTQSDIYSLAMVIVEVTYNLSSALRPSVHYHVLVGVHGENPVSGRNKRASDNNDVEGGPTVETAWR
jgi:hypothetical protein